MKKENFPNKLNTIQTITPVTMAQNIPPAPNALDPNPGSPSATISGVIEIKNKIKPVAPAIKRCFLKRFFSQKLNGIKNATNTEIIPIVQPNGVQKENGKVINDSKTVPTQNNEPNKINGNTCITESLIVTTQIL